MRNGLKNMSNVDLDLDLGEIEDWFTNLDDIIG